MEILHFVTETWLAVCIGVIAGILVANYLLVAIQHCRYGGWPAIWKQKGRASVCRDISPREAQDMLEESAARVVLLKDAASSDGWINGNRHVSIRPGGVVI